MSLPARFDERRVRLALGIEPIDALRGQRLSHRIHVTFDDVPLGLPRPQVVRHGSGLFVLVHGDGVGTDLTLRLFDIGEPTDPAHFRGETSRRRCVPRRLRIPIPSPADADALPVTRRSCRPMLFPGAAYDVCEAVTGLRSRVLRAGAPVRWARVEARRPGAAPGDAPVGRAHCDEHGEFLLILDPAAAPMAALESPFQLDLVAHAPDPPAPLPPAEQRAADELWDLPVETLTPGDAPDPVAEGAFPPAGWSTAGPATSTEFHYGRLRSDVPALSV